jgi:hypothetical protein
MYRNLCGLRPLANYTDRVTAACQRSWCKRLRVEVATWSARRIPTAVFSTFQTGTATFSFKELLSCTHEVEWTPFQTHYFSENLVAPGIEPGHLDLQPGTMTTRPQRRSTFFYIAYINSVCTSQETHLSYAARNSDH